MLVDPNFQDAEQLLLALDPNTDRFTFQTFDDLKERRHPHLARIVHGALADFASELASLNARGAGIFICINATDLKGRGASHITRIRGIWQDDDLGWQGKFPLTPSLVVRTSPGRFQRLWLCDGLTIDRHCAVQERLAVSFGHDRRACGVNRVLRLPGFWHIKNPDTPHIVRVIDGIRSRYSAAEILAAFPPIEQPPARNWRPHSDDEERICNALMSISTDAMDRWKWVQIGMALKAHFGDGGLELWDAWSRQSEHYDRRGLERAWRSFRRSGVTIATLFFYSKGYGRAA